MKKIPITLIFIIILSQILFAGEPLRNFDAVMDALKTGKTVKVVIEYKTCQLISDNEISEKIPDAIGGMEISVFEYFAEKSIRNDEAFVVASESKLIKNPKGEGYVINYAKIKLFKSGKVKITAQYIDPISYQTKMDENFFCNINNGENNGGVSFFKH